MRIHVLHCGYVYTSPYLPFDTDGASRLKVAGIGVPKKNWVWMPVSAYYIEHPEAKILVDTGWSRMKGYQSQIYSVFRNDGGKMYH